MMVWPAVDCVATVAQFLKYEYGAIARYIHKEETDLRMHAYKHLEMATQMTIYMNNFT